MEAESIPQQVQENIEKVETADLVVGVLADLDEDGLVAIYDAFRTLPGSPRIAILRDDQAFHLAQANSETSEKSSSPNLIPWPLSRLDTPGLSMGNISAAYQSVFAASETFGARACCVIASKLERETGWARQLAQLLLEENVDLVMPYYARHKFDGLLNSSIVAPLTRCLYGKRIHNPLGPDLGVSRRLFETMLALERGTRGTGNRVHPLASLAPAAICDNLQVCEINVSARIYSPTDWTNMSSVIARRSLSPIFLDMERNAACTVQRMRPSVFCAYYW